MKLYKIEFKTLEYNGLMECRLKARSLVDMYGFFNSCHKNCEIINIYEKVLNNEWLKLK